LQRRVYLYSVGTDPKVNPRNCYQQFEGTVTTTNLHKDGVTP